MKINKTIKYATLIASVILSSSCSKTQSLDQQIIKNTQLNSESRKVAKDFSENNKLIAVDYAKFKNNLDSKSVTPEEQGQMRAALYRFYKRVSIKNGKLEMNVTNGGEINLSDDLFKYFYDGLQVGNRQLDSLRKKGIEVSMPVIDENYLNSLLN